MDFLTIVALVVGGVLLVVGAEGLVRGASRLAASMGIPAIIVGLTVVAFGTSAPELAVSVSSALDGEPDIAMGNVVGSNIINVLFILGITAVITPLVVHERIIFLEVPLMVGVSVLLFVFAFNGNVSRIEGVIFVAALLGYLVFLIRQGRKEGSAVIAEYEEEFAEVDRSTRAVARDVVFVLVGLALLVIGSDLFVGGAVDIAEALGVSELVIGLTVVALGTSLPEVATSILASLKGERDIAVGNIVGSNIFNILSVLGITAIVADGGIAAADAAIDFDIPVMLGIAILLAPVIYTKREVSRWEGFLFLGFYAMYTVYLLLNANDHSQADNFRGVMLGVVVPITVTIVLITAIREIILLRKSGAGFRGTRSTV